MDQHRSTVRAKADQAEQHLKGCRSWYGWVIWSVVASGVATLPEVLYRWSLVDVHRQYWTNALARVMES